ncbi:hypothetical protein L6452_39140 [Arctium lappa]|uniref:Uncharacterized protein n=1 Tax=Arctium lappa TaxID=4217 RepID=A0ACB8XS45_ARCLA|nr:hypothetical protein L6452_39140 [Arctium lappa]
MVGFRNRNQKLFSLSLASKKCSTSRMTKKLILLFRGRINGLIGYEEVVAQLEKPIAKVEAEPNTKGASSGADSEKKTGMCMMLSLWSWDLETTEVQGTDLLVLLVLTTLACNSCH